MIRRHAFPMYTVVKGTGLREYCILMRFSSFFFAWVALDSLMCCTRALLRMGLSFVDADKRELEEAEGQTKRICGWGDFPCGGLFKAEKAVAWDVNNEWMILPNLGW